jgi:hypothetical protein
MNFAGFPITDATDFQDQIDSLDSRVTVLEGDVVTINNQLTTIGTHAIYTGAPIALNSTSPTDLTPSSGIIGSLTIPFAECKTGMTLRLTVMGEIAIDPADNFRLYLAQDAIGNFPFSSVDWVTTSTNAGTTFFPCKHTFTILFQQLSAPLTIFSETEYQWNNLVKHSTGSVNPITSTGVVLHIIGQFQNGGGVSTAYRMKNFVLERVGPY